MIVKRRPEEVQKRIIHRLKIARGHLDKVIRMVEEEDYCIAVIHQSQAIQSALKQVDNLLLDHHLKTCVILQLREGKEQALEEVMEVFKKQEQ